MRIKLQQDLTNKRICDAFHEFMLNCKVKNLSPKTLIFYEEGYNIFTDYHDEKKLISSIDKNIINEYIIFLSSKTNLSTVSINTRLRSIRSFLYYCMKLGYIDNFTIELLKCEKKIKETYSDAELKLLLKKPNLKQCSFSELEIG
jgi:integrase/recombinase XerD